MALNEFAPGRENIQSEVNAFLKEQWGIDSYLQLIPVVLIQSDTKKEGKHAAFPIVRSNLYSETTGVEWAGYASGEDQMLGIRFEGYSGKIKMVGVPIQTGTEWKVTGNLWQELSENRGGYFPKRVFGKVAGLLLCPQFYVRSTWPERIHFMGRLENLYSHEEKDLALVDFRKQGNIMSEFKAGLWLKEMVKTRHELVAGNPRVVAKTS